MEQKFDNAMRRQVYSIPELITQQYDLMEPRIREALSFQEIFSQIGRASCRERV